MRKLRNLVCLVAVALAVCALYAPHAEATGGGRQVFRARAVLRPQRVIVRQEAVLVAPSGFFAPAFVPPPCHGGFRSSAFFFGF